MLCGLRTRGVIENGINLNGNSIALLGENLNGFYANSNYDRYILFTLILIMTSAKDCYYD
jgi:hypothetical protein